MLTRASRAAPLGDLYRGECRASAEPHQPAESELRDWCNLGYGRQGCGRFPAGTEAHDAARFSIARDCDGNITVRYSLERDHRPGECGELCYARAGRAFVTPHANPLINRLAEAYVEAYLRGRP